MLLRIRIAGSHQGGVILVRDTADRDSAMITVYGAAWAQLTAAIRPTA